MTSKDIKKMKDALKIIDELNVKYNTNLLYNEKYVEILIADQLKLITESIQQGADAQKGNEDCEIKAINLATKTKNKTYQFHWLSEEKMKKLKNVQHYFFARRSFSKILDIYYLPKKIIWNILCSKGSADGSISAHTGFSHDQIISFGAKKVETINDL